MPTSQQLIQKIQTHTQKQKASYYQGPTVYRGQTINVKHSIRKVSRTLLQLLRKTQFASLNIIGIPGSGKTTCAVNIVTDLVEMASKEFNMGFIVLHAGPEELRDLGNFLESIPKHQNIIIIFDDISKALDRLSGAEQSDVFEKLTTTRHTTGGRLCFINLFHYSYAHQKSVKSQSVITIYTSCSLVEKGNIIAMLGTSNKLAISKLRKFMKVYNASTMYDKFELPLGPNNMQEYIAEHPFRPCFVINLTQAHIALFMVLEDSPFWPPEKMQKEVDTDFLVKMIDNAYGADGHSALRFHMLQRGYTVKSNQHLIQAYKFIQEKVINVYRVNWPKLMKGYGETPVKIYRKRRMENELTKLMKEEGLTEPQVSDNTSPETPKETLTNSTDNL